MDVRTGCIYPQEAFERMDEATRRHLVPMHREPTARQLGKVPRGIVDLRRKP